MNTIQTDKLYRSGEVMHLIGCKNTKFWSLVKAEAFEVRRMGKSVVVPGASLKAFIDGLPPAINREAA